jgi:hypothetical protein
VRVYSFSSMQVLLLFNNPRSKLDTPLNSTLKTTREMDCTQAFQSFAKVTNLLPDMLARNRNGALKAGEKLHRDAHERIEREG